MYATVVRISGRRVTLRDGVTVAAGSALVAGAVSLVANPETNYMKRYLSVAGARAITAVLGAMLFVALLGFVWLRLRDSGVLPILMAREERSGVRVGGPSQWLTGRTVEIARGEQVCLVAGQRYPLPGNRGSDEYVYEWRLVASAGEIRQRTWYAMTGRKFAVLAHWLEGLGAQLSAFEDHDLNEQG